MTTIEASQVCSLGQLVDEVARLSGSSEGISWFRGHQDAKWGVVPSIWRLGDKTQEVAVAHKFRARAQHRMQSRPAYDDLPEWLSTMQHYGLPTRLLDWSTSPMVASYFALEYLLDDPKAEPCDAAVWLLRPTVLNVAEGLEGEIFSINSKSCIPFLRPVFYPQNGETGQVRAVMASVHDNRIFVQQGAFTIHSRQEPLEETPGASKYLSKIVIPAESAASVAEQLRVSGYRRGDIFPDLANLALELKMELISGSPS